MYRTILVPLDGSEFAERSLPLAQLLASRIGAELHLVHVIRPAPDVDFKLPQEDLAWRERVREGAERYLQGHAAAAAESGVSALTAVLEGQVSAAIQEYVREQEVDLIALTSHGSGGLRRWWLGSVADALLRGGESDVLLVRPWDETEDRPAEASRFQRILVPLDGSELAEGALATARDLAERFAASFVAIRVVPEPVELTSIYGVPGVQVGGEGHLSRLQDAEDHLEGVAQRYEGLPFETQVVEGSGAADGIVDAAKALGADLIVLSSRGRGGIERVVMGSVADKVVRSTTRPVLVVHPRDSG